MNRMYISTPLPNYIFNYIHIFIAKHKEKIHTETTKLFMAVSSGGEEEKWESHFLVYSLPCCLNSFYGNAFVHLILFREMHSNNGTRKLLCWGLALKPSRATVREEWSLLPLPQPEPSSVLFIYTHKWASFDQRLLWQPKFKNNQLCSSFQDQNTQKNKDGNLT